MIDTIPLELAKQAYQDEMKSAAIKKRVSISCGSMKTDDDNISIGGVSNRRWRQEAVVSVVMPDICTDEEEKRKKMFTPSIVEYVKVFSILYALVMTLIGLIFPISEALTDNWMRSTYNAVFVSYQLLVSIAFLVYLQVFAVLQKRMKGKKNRSKTAVNFDEASLANSYFGDSNLRNNISSSDENLDSRVRSPAANRLKNLEPSNFETRTGGYSEDSLAVGGSSLVPKSLYPRRPSIYANFDSRRPSIYTDYDGQSNYGDDNSNTSMVWMDVSKFGSIFNHEGSSLFLKFGALLFSLGNIIYYALEIENGMKENYDCKLTYMLGWTFVLRLIFVLVQTFFIFKGPEVDQTKHLPILWFGMLHLASTNICLWFRIVIQEISKEATNERNQPNQLHQNHNANAINSDFNYENNSCETVLLQKASRYLFPFVLEYSLIAVGTIACIIYSISQPTDSEGNLVKGLRNLIKVCSLHQTSKSSDDRNSESDEEEHSGEHVLLNKSHGGMFLGSLLFSGVIVTIVLFYFYEDEAISSTIIYLVADLILHSFLLFSCFLVLVLIRPLAYVAKPMSTDDAFLVVAMCGSAMYEIAIIVASAGSIEEDVVDKQEDILRLAVSLVAVVETIVQTMVILCAFRRYPSSEEHVTKMPGRGTFTFLIVGNVSVWVLRTALAKSIEVTTMLEFYGNLPWLLLANVNLPLLLFYRFHCSVCFADVWHAAYTPLQKKLKKLKRQPNTSRRTAEDGNPSENNNISLQVPQICIIGASNEKNENALEQISSATYA